MKGKEKKTICGKQYYCFICIGIFYKGNSIWFCLNRHKSSLDMNRKRNMIHKRCVYEQLLRALPVMVPEASFIPCTYRFPLTRRPWLGMRE